LVDTASPAAGVVNRPTWAICALRRRAGIVFTDQDIRRPQVGKRCIAMIAKDQRLASVADENPNIVW
jgi:hypothetical protein